MDMNTLTDWVRQNAVIESNPEYAYVAVDFSNAIAEWHDPMELAHFVAELFPLREWLSVGVSPGEDDFQVSAWWCSDEYADACQKSAGDEGELPLTPEGREKLAALVRSSVVIDDAEMIELKIDRGLSRLFGEKTLVDFIAEQFPGWEVPEYERYPRSTTADGAHVYRLWPSSSEEEAA